MSTINELTEKYRKYSYDELLSRATSDVKLLLPVFHKVASDGNGKPYLLLFMLGAIVSDGKVSDDEYRFIKDLIGLGREEIDVIIGRRKSESAMSLADRIFDNCSPRLKSSLLELCLCFAVVDNDIDNKETEFIARLLT